MTANEDESMQRAPDHELDARAVAAAFAAMGIALSDARAESVVRAMRRLAPSADSADEARDPRDASLDHSFDTALRHAR